MAEIPKYHELMNPVLQALRELGGSASNDELYEKVAELLKLPESILSVLHNPEKDSRSEVHYRLAWARTYLKKYGAITNSERSIWSLMPDYKEAPEVDPGEVIRYVRELDAKETPEEGLPSQEASDVPSEEKREELWREQLYHSLTQGLSPQGFERLAQRLLREAGFVQVEITGRSGDGGIDGVGIMKLGGLLSFHVVFQCKRYQGSVSSPQIRDFRGAMMGRGEKGIFLTTGTFTRDALKEASRDGAPPIELVDGSQLADMMKDLNLGVRKVMVEKVIVDVEWLKNV